MFLSFNGRIASKNIISNCINIRNFTKRKVQPWLATRFATNNKVYSKLVTSRYINSSEPLERMASSGVELSFVLKKLNSFASVELSESWDNVGLLIEPATPQPISCILLTNDLTEAVMKEALDISANMIISYHPPIFAPLKSVTAKTWKERIVAACLENRIALYSPHTSFDAVKGGVNDWLSGAFDTKWVKPIIQSYVPGNYLLELTVMDSSITDAGIENLRTQMIHSSGPAGDIPSISESVKSPVGTKLKIQCSKASLAKLEDTIDNFFASTEHYQLQKLKFEELPLADHGMGRLCLLTNPLPVSEVIEKLKKHLHLPHLRLALAVGKDMNSEVSTIGLCAGSGVSVLKKTRADLLLTGEMLHHDVLDAVHKGSHVILTNHSDSERGFLVHFAKTLGTQLLEDKAKVVVSKQDKDPLQTV